MTRNMLCLCLCTLLCFLLVRVESFPQNESVPLYRLPNTTFPIHYKLHINSNIHLNQFEYDGYVIIDIEVHNSTDEIVLHAGNLTDFEINVLELRSGKLIPDLTYTSDSRANFLVIHPKKRYLAFETGQNYRVDIKFKGVMASEGNGFYWLNYTDSQNQTTYMAATQLEPTYARSVYPCFDEPSRKANFSLSITHGHLYQVISNMPILNIKTYENENNENISKSENYVSTTTFETTPIMATYLLAFVVYKDFNFISEQCNGIEHRLYAKNVTIERDYLKRSIQTLVAFEEYFDIKFPLPKLDHIGLNKLSATGMENWGLITYSDKIFSKKVYKKQVTALISHEIAHQWFGNLVTPEWWTYTWMNEGFATYFAYVITEKLFPELNVMNFFYSDILIRSYNQDKIEPRPMSHYVNNGNITDIFDDISYNKAACVIRMFHYVFNQKTFIRGISGFLKKWKYATGNEAKFIEEIESAVKQDPELSLQPWIGSVKEIITSWTQTIGVPTLIVTRNQSENTVMIKRQSEDRRWIPLTFATKSSPNFENTTIDYFMQPIETEIRLNLSDFGIYLKEGDWLLVNKQLIGVYNVIYDAENQRDITNQLLQNHTKIHALNRAAMLNSVSNAFYNKSIPIEAVFDRLSYLEHEEDFIVWSYWNTMIMAIDESLRDSASLDLYRNFIRRLLRPGFKRWRTKPISEYVAEGEIGFYFLSCEFDVPECLEYSRILNNDYIMGKTEDVIEILLPNSVKNLSVEDFNTILPLLSNADPKSKWYNDMLYALSYMQNHNNIKQYLNLLMNDHLNDKSDALVNIFKTLQHNMESYPIVFEFLESNYKKLSQSFLFLELIFQRYMIIRKEYKERFVTLQKQIIQELIPGKAAKNQVVTDVPVYGDLYKEFLMKYENDINAWLLRYKEQFALLNP